MAFFMFARRVIFGVALIAIFTTNAAYAQLGSPKNLEFSPLKQTSGGKVAAIIDGLHLTLDDGRVIELSDIIHPESAPEIALQAKQTLEKFFIGKDILFFQTPDKDKGRVNRMGHHLGHVVLRDKETSLWAQDLLLRNGLALTLPGEDAPVMRLFEAEDSARNDEIGLWAEELRPLFLRTPENAAESMGTFAIVTGTPQAVASVKNNTYLNYGKNWRKDFTVMVSSQMRKQISRDGIDLKSWVKNPVEVRGWIIEENGPMIMIDRTTQLRLRPAPEQDNETDSTN